MALRFDLTDPAIRANPYPMYATLRRESPVCQVDPGSMWAVSRYNDVQFVLKNPRLFSSTGFEAQLSPDWLDEENPQIHSILVVDPPIHTQLRGLLSQAFVARNISRLERRVQAFIDKLADDLQARGEVDFLTDFAAPLPACVIADMLGLDASLHVLFKRWGSSLTAINPAPPSAEKKASVHRSLREMKEYLKEVIEERRRHPAEDMVTDLLNARIEGNALSDEDIIAFLFLLLPAGFETTTNLIANAMLILLERPEDLARLRADRSLIPPFLEEVLRYESPVQGLVRRATEDVEIGGVKVPKDGIVVPLLASANRDEEHFTDPDQFDIDRGTQGGFAFGHGIHFCLGVTLARMEGRMGFETLLSRFAKFELVPGTVVPYSPATLLRAPVSLPLRLIPA